jgi:uncharacterized membrane protein YjdF
MRNLFGLSRNHYDRLVHFSFGLLMLLPIRELAIREPQAMGRFAVFYWSVSAVASGSVMYAIIEWLVADPAARHGLPRHAGRRLGRAEGHGAGLRRRTRSGSPRSASSFVR